MFEQQVITSRGLFLLNQMKTQMDSRLSFVGVFGSDERVSNENLFRLEPHQLSAWTQGTLFKVYPTKYANLNDTRIAVSFNDNNGEGRSLKSVALLARLMRTQTTNPSFAQVSITPELSVRAKQAGVAGNDYFVQFVSDSESAQGDIIVSLRRGSDELGSLRITSEMSVEDVNASSLVLGSATGTAPTTVPLSEHVEFVGTFGNLFNSSAITFREALSGGSDGEESEVPVDEPIVFAVATTDTAITIKNDGKNNIFFTFQLLITNGYARIKADEHARALLQDIEDASKEDKGGVATIMFNAATSDLQLFDREGHLIDQANLPAGFYNNGEFVTIRNRQNVYDEKIWISPKDVIENANTLYEFTDEEQGVEYGIVAGLPLVDKASKGHADHFVSYLMETDEVGLFSVVLSENDGMSFELFSDSYSSLTKLSQPSVRDFFNISEDRDVNTLEDVGDDSVAVFDIESVSPIQALRLWQGYSQLALSRNEVQDALASRFVSLICEYDPSELISDEGDDGSSQEWLVSYLYDLGVISSSTTSLESAKQELNLLMEAASDNDETVRTKRHKLAREFATSFPNAIGFTPDDAIEDVIGIPSVAVFPEDIRKACSLNDVAVLKEKYSALGTEENGLLAANADTLADVLRGIYEAQVENARKAYIAADNAWKSIYGVHGLMHSVAVSSDGVTFRSHEWGYRIHLRPEKNGGQQKIALSRMDGANASTFAFIGDSGVLGGAPLFTVIVAAHAEMSEGVSTWRLDSLSSSDGFIPELFGGTDGLEHGEGVSQWGDDVVFNVRNVETLVVRLADNLSNLPFNHVSMDIQGVTGVNRIPCEQFKHLNCIVPLYMESQDSRGCAVNMTEILNSWVQTEDMYKPDIIIIRGYGLFIQTQK